MIRTYWIAALAFPLVAAMAQTPSQTAYRGQSWVGLLVSPACEKGKPQSGDKSNASREADLTVNSRTTTPAVDDAGTRGSATASDAGAKSPGEKQTKPETGDVLAKGKSSGDPAWAAAHKQAQSLGASCSLAANSTQFGLLLPDGRMLQFDELANQAIAKQLTMPGAGSKDGKMVFRVSVQGKLQNGKIALDSIQM